MKTNKHLSKLSFTTSLILLLFVGCNNGKTEKNEKVTSESEQAVVDKEIEDETLMDSLIENLSGIEYFFVKYREVFNDKNSIYNNLLSLLEYKNDPNYDKLKHNHTIQSRILILDSKNGYLVTEQTESLNYFTYWNLTNGTGNKLFANVSRGCGPACNDNIWFYKIVKSSSEDSKYLFEKVNPSDIIENFIKLPEILIGHEIDDYYPISINLPQTGKNILMCYSNDINLIQEDDDSLERKGDCIELMWDGNQGIFRPGEQIKK